jgi:isoleucyl-tRNA synthetase
MLANLAGFDPAQDMLPDEGAPAPGPLGRRCAARLQEDLRRAYDGYQFHQVCSRLHNFCANGNGRLLSRYHQGPPVHDARGQLPRRSAQTALYRIADAMARWMAPILSFTAEEIWENLPGRARGLGAAGGWGAGRCLRLGPPTAPSMRPSGTRRSSPCAPRSTASSRSCAARVSCVAPWMRRSRCIATTHCRRSLARLGDELRFVLITSAAAVEPLAAAPETAAATEVDGLRVESRASTAAKCARCWHRRDDVGSDPRIRRSAPAA